MHIILYFAYVFGGPNIFMLIFLQDFMVHMLDIGKPIKSLQGHLLMNDGIQLKIDRTRWIQIKA